MPVAIPRWTGGLRINRAHGGGRSILLQWQGERRAASKGGGGGATVVGTGRLTTDLARVRCFPVGIGRCTGGDEGRPRKGKAVHVASPAGRYQARSPMAASPCEDGERTKAGPTDWTD